MPWMMVIVLEQSVTLMMSYFQHTDLREVVIISYICISMLQLVTFPEWRQDWEWSLCNTGLILGLHPANEKRSYKVTLSLIGWAQT